MHGGLIDSNHMWLHYEILDSLISQRVSWALVQADSGTLNTYQLR